MILIGHSMGGLIAARYAQLHSEELVGLVLSGPAIGGNVALEGLLDLDPIPEIPIDPASLSRDPNVARDYAADPLVWNGPFQRQTLEALIAAIADVAEGPRWRTSSAGPTCSSRSRPALAARPPSLGATRRPSSSCSATCARSHGSAGASPPTT